MSTQFLDYLENPQFLIKLFGSVPHVMELLLYHIRFDIQLHTITLTFETSLVPKNKVNHDFSIFSLSFFSVEDVSLSQKDQKSIMHMVYVRPKENKQEISITDEHGQIMMFLCHGFRLDGWESYVRGTL